MDWTHKQIRITDIRKIKKFYVISISEAGVGSMLIAEDIFNERIKSYFLKDVKDINREDIINVTWNMYITKGYYIKPDLTVTNGITKFSQNADKWYVSFLEIHGPLGSFDTIMPKSKN